MNIAPIVILSPSQIKNVLSRPRDEVDAVGPQLDLIHQEYTLPEKEVYRNGFHWQIFRQELVRKLPLLTQGIAEEIDKAFEQVWGTCGEWTTVYAWNTILKIVSQTSNRAFSGIDLCAHFISSSVTEMRRELTDSGRP